MRFRCPNCQKLYRTHTDVFEGANPEFECDGCRESFLLDKSRNEFGLFETKTKAYFFAECPKCTKLMPGELKECPSCGVFVEKYQQITQSESPTLFQMNQLWKQVLENFNDDQLHQNFLNLCHKNLALSFAFQKYDELRKAMNYDAKCEKYLNQIEVRLEQQFLAQQSAQNSQKENPKRKLGQRIFAWVSLCGLCFLVFNRIRPTFANLNGVVVAITVLAFSLWLVSSQNKTNIKF